MRIAIISGCFQLGRSYQENVWAEELARTGHTVRVLAAGERSSPPRAVDVEGHSYEVQEIATRRWPRTVLVSRGADEGLRDFGPDLILWIAVGHHFGKEFLRAGDLAGIPLVTTWSEHFGMHEYDWRKRGIPLRQRIWAFGYWTLRRRVIAAACRRSTLIVGNTPHARHIVTIPFRGAERRAIDAKTVDVPLGYDPKAFAFEPLLRERARGALGLGRWDVLVCASSRFDPDKLPFLLTIVEALRGVMGARPRVKAVLVGLTDSPTSARFRQEVASGAMAERFVLEPFADRRRLNELYNASDVAVFGRASISCQESLGTGLVACFSDEGSLHHLVEGPQQAVFFRRDSSQDLQRGLKEAIAILDRHAGPDRLAFRRSLAEASRWLGYDRVISRVLELLARRRAAPGAAPAPGAKG